jgi:inositol oxygenase
VNVLKTKTWNDQSEFDAAKDKAQFRQYEDACDRVKGFYKEQHGMQRDTIRNEAAC